MEIVKRLIIVLASTAVTLAVFEVTLRVGNYMPEYVLQLKTIAGAYGRLPIVLDEQLLYRVKPSSRSDINSSGYRDGEFGPKSDTRKRVLVYGDSFVMANNLEPDQTIPKQLGELMGLKAEVLNLGISGYGPDQALLRFEEDSPALSPDQVILLIFAGNDFADLVENELFRVAANGISRSKDNLVTHSLPNLRTAMLLRMVFQKRFLPTTLEDKISAAFIQDETVLGGVNTGLMSGVLRLWQEKAPTLIIGIIPSLKAFEEEDFVNEDTLEEICGRLKLKCVRFFKNDKLSYVKKLYDPVYRHLNDLGAVTVAQKLKEELGESN